MNGILESEYKFLVKRPDTLDEIANLNEIADFRLTNPRTIIQEDTYFDTHDQFFYVNGMQCRVRKKEGIYTLTFKTPIEEAEAKYERSEFTATINSNQIPLFCDRTLESESLRAINELITQLIGNNGLVETLIVHTQRKMIDLVKGDIVLVLDLDGIVYQRPLTKKTVQEYELEIEKDHTPLAHLERIVSYLKDQFPLIESPAPKYQRGMQLTS